MTQPDDENDDGASAARAVTAVARATLTALDVGREFGRFCARVLAAPIEEGAGIVHDHLRYTRWERQQRLMQRANEVAAELGIAMGGRRVPLKIALPIFQGAAMEEDDQLQDIWVNLLLNASRSDSKVEIQRAYIAILEQLTPIDVRILNMIYQLPFDDIQRFGICTQDLPRTVRSLVPGEQLMADKVPADYVQLSLGNLCRLGCLRPGSTWSGAENFLTAHPTVLGFSFVQACTIRQN